MNMYFIFMEGRHGAIYTDDYSGRGYYITKFSSYAYNFHSDSSIDGQVISSYEMVCEGAYLFPINMSSHYYVLQRTKSINKTVSLRTIFNGNINIICYDLKDVVQPCLRSISQNDYNTLSTLNIPTKEHDNAIDEKNLIKSIELGISVSIETQDNTYNYNDKYCYYI